MFVKTITFIAVYTMIRAAKDATSTEYAILREQRNDSASSGYNQDQFKKDAAELFNNDNIPAENSADVIDGFKQFLPKKCFFKKGLTWRAAQTNCKLDITQVSCSGGYGPKCNPYQGDTICYLRRPILCLKKANVPRPNYSYPPCSSCAMSSYPQFYNGWSEGFLKTTRPVRGCTI